MNALDEFDSLMQESPKTIQRTAPIRNNNPGALMPKGKMAQYATPEDGIGALDSNLKDYGKKGINTLEGVIGRWAPPNENDTASYVADVSKRLSLHPKKTIDLNDPIARHAISAAIMLHENGSNGIFREGGNPASESLSANAPAAKGALAEFDSLMSQPQSKREEPRIKQEAKQAGRNKGDSVTTGAIEFLANQASGMASTVAGGFSGAAVTAHALTHGKSLDEATNAGADTVNKIREDYTYQPRGNAGKKAQEIFESKLNPLNWPAVAGDYAGGKIADAGMPGIGAAVNAGLTTAPMLLGLRGGKNAAPVAKGIAERIEPTMESRPVTSSAQQTPTTNPNVRAATSEIPSQYASAGSSGSHVIGRLGTASEEFRADAMAQIEHAKQVHGDDYGNHINWDALDRHLNADSLPIPGRLTQGQATKDPALTSQEWNNRSNNGLMPMFEDQNDVQRLNLQHIRETATPDVYTTSHFDHAGMLIDGYEKLHAKEKGVIDAKWKAIRDESSDKMIFNADQMFKDSQEALKKQKLSTHDPDGQLTELGRSKKAGGMTADEYVAWRQNLGRVAMRGGNEGKAASIMLDATNKSALLPDAVKYRDMVNDALTAGRALHIKLANDPAYNAVADGKASTTDFSQKFIINGKAEKLANMRDNLAGHDGASQTIKAVFLDQLRNSASLNNKYEGSFGASDFNKTLDKVASRGTSIFQDGELQSLRALGDYASHTNFNGKSGYKDWSNTETARVADTPSSTALNIAAGAAEAGLNLKTGGLSAPVIAVGKSFFKKRAEQKALIEEQKKAADYIHESTRPAAGLIKK